MFIILTTYTATLYRNNCPYYFSQTHNSYKTRVFIRTFSKRADIRFECRYQVIDYRSSSVSN